MTAGLGPRLDNQQGPIPNSSQMIPIQVLCFALILLATTKKSDLMILKILPLKKNNRITADFIQQPDSNYCGL
jgi:hypothetical protein